MPAASVWYVDRSNNRPLSLSDKVDRAIADLEKGLHGDKMALADAFDMSNATLVDLTGTDPSVLANIPMGEQRPYLVDRAYTQKLLDKCHKLSTSDSATEDWVGSPEGTPQPNMGLILKTGELRTKYMHQRKAMLPGLVPLVIGEAATRTETGWTTNIRTNAELEGYLPRITNRLALVSDILNARAPLAVVELMKLLPGMDGEERASMLATTLTKRHHDDADKKLIKQLLLDALGKAFLSESQNP